MTQTEAPTAKCLDCGRTLKAATSIARQRGPLCATRKQAAASFTTHFKNADAAQDKALQLIKDKGIIRTRIAGQYLAVSSDGTQNYLVDIVENSCMCPAGCKGRHCYHLVAANVCEITATRKTAAYALAA